MSIYVIAELGINANGSVETAKQLIDAAKDAGCDAIKFQKRTVDVVYTEEELARPRESPFGHTNGDLKRGLEFSAHEYDQIAAAVRTCGLDWSASCWDAGSVEFLLQYHPPWLKIPSALITDLPLVKAYQGTGLPIIVSTGMSTWEEIDACVEALGYAQITLLHCHSSYPSPLDEINLACLQSFKDRYAWHPRLTVGYSSHTVSPWPCLMAAVYGAEVIEFHLTLDRASWGSDQAASLEPHAAKKLIEEIRTFEICKGDGIKRVYDSERPSLEKLRKKKS